MKLSLKLILRCIARGEARIVAQRSVDPDPMRLRCLMLWDKNAGWEDHVAWVIPAQQVTDDFACPKGAALIVLGDADPGRLAQADADVLLWRPTHQELPFQEQFNHLSAVFQEYQAQELRLLERLSSGSPLAELMTLGEKLLNNPIVLMDEGYSLMVKPRRSNPLDWEAGKFHQAPTLSAETVDQIRMSREFRSRDRHQGLFYLPNDTLDCGVLFLHTRADAVNFFLGVLEMDQPITEADRQLLLYFSEYVSFALRTYRFSRVDSLFFLQFLTKLLRNEKIELPEFNRQLQSRQWNINEHYVCFVAEPDLWNQKDTQSFTLCRLIESQFRGSVAFYHEDRVVCLVNLDQAGLDRQVFLHLLSQFIRDQVLRVGVSYGFRDFVSVPNYYHQALAALELGRQYSPDEWNYRFERYVLEYFIRYGTSRMEGRYLCHPDLITLHEYDRQNHTELLQTLKVYLACGQNATTAASELFIHRNTLYQRLSKIESLISDNLSSPETRLYMQLSYSIVDFGKSESP